MDYYERKRLAQEEILKHISDKKTKLSNEDISELIEFKFQIGKKTILKLIESTKRFNN